MAKAENMNVEQLSGFYIEVLCKRSDIHQKAK